MRYPGSLYKGLALTHSTPHVIGGYRRKGVKVKRHAKFRFLPMRRSGWSDRRIHVPIKAHSSVRGDNRDEALQRVAVVLLVKNFTRTRWTKVKPQGATSFTANFELPRTLAKKVSHWSNAKVRNRIIARAAHVVDADKINYQWRRTADVVKLHHSTYGESRAKAANTTANPQLTVTNEDYIDFNDTWAAPNLVATANSCMQTIANGDNYWSVTGAPPAQAVQADFSNNSGLAQPANQAPGSQQVWSALVDDIAEAVVETALGRAQKATTGLYDAIEEVGELMIGDCNENPGLFALSAADANGNSTIQGYSTFQPWNNGVGFDNWDGDSVGGVADVESATYVLNTFASGACWHGSRQEAECGPFQFKDEATRAANYIQNSYLPNSGSSFGDFGLAMQIQPGPQGTAQISTYSGKGQSDNPDIDLNVNWNQGCSSTFGGVPNTAGTSYPPPAKGFWTDAVAGLDEAPCPPQDNPGNAFLTPVSESAPVISYPGENAHNLPNPGTVLTVSNGTWTNTPDQFTYAWYNSTGTQIGTGPTWTVPDNMPGQTVYATVTASNDAGATGTTSSPAASNIQTIGYEAAPAVVTPPALSVIGNSNGWEAGPGQGIEVSTGDWDWYNNATTRTYSYAWYNCPQGGSPVSECLQLQQSYTPTGTAPITSDTTTIYTNTTAVESWIVAQVTATDNYGSTTVTATNPIYIDGTVLPTEMPVIMTNDQPVPFSGWSGVEEGNPTWTVTNGTWPTVEGGLTFTYSWVVCNELSAAVCKNKGVRVGTDNSIEFDSIDLPERFDGNFWISAWVTATSQTGTETIVPATAAFHWIDASYVLTDPDTDAPSITTQSVTDLAGNVITEYGVDSATWSPNPNVDPAAPSTQPTSYGYQWYACLNAACELDELIPVGNATSSTYSPTSPTQVMYQGSTVNTWGLRVFQYAYNNTEYDPPLVNMAYSDPIQYGSFG